MNQKMLFILWGILFAVCTGLGLMPEAPGVLGTVAGCCSFLPPAFILYRARKAGDRNCIKLIRNLSLSSLVLTLVLLVANLFAALGSQALGTVLHILLGILSAPMYACGYWVLSLFLWACLLMASLSFLKQKRR